MTTPIGVQGYRFGDRELPLSVATSARGFADTIAHRLAHRPSLAATRARLHRFTWEEAGPDLASTLERVAWPLAV